MRIILFSNQTYDRESFLAANHGHGFELHFQQAHLQPGHRRPGQGLRGGLPLRQRRPLAPGAGAPGRRRHAPDRPALGRLQPRRPGRRPRAGPGRGARPGLFAPRRGRARGRPDPDAQPAPAPRLQPDPRGRLLAAWADRLRPPRHTRRRDRHRTDRRGLRPHHGRLRLPPPGLRPLSQSAPSRPWAAATWRSTPCSPSPTSSACIARSPRPPATSSTRSAWRR